MSDAGKANVVYKPSALIQHDINEAHHLFITDFALIDRTRTVNCLG